MDTSHLQPSHTLVNIVIGAVLGFLFSKLVPYCSILFMEVYQKLKTLIASRSPTPNEPPNTREDPSSSEFVIGEYGVFLSFHGEDTRNTFVCHLYKELDRKGIRTFRDDKRLEKGKSISPCLIEAIEKSKISIVVFSPNYASSSWCLDELLKIVECMETKQQLVLPVFVDVDPSDVEKQRGTFEKAFINHRSSSVQSDQIQKWRDALSQISTIVGWDSRKCFDGNQAELIDFIAGEVSKRLTCNESVPEDSVVGIDSHMMHIDEKLDLKCPDVRMLGIWGPGGIGKTTIARFIYDKYSTRYGYEACCFLRDIKDKYKQKDGAIALQELLISDTLSEKNLIIRDEIEGCNFIRRLQNKKVLIVLDDVDEKKQLELLAMKVEWFGPGSRIIITTRDRRLLVQHEVENIYEVQYLKKDKALQLFSLHAFKKNEPPKDFLELSDSFVYLTQCLPLALKVLGSSLYKREMGFWHDQLDKLRKYPDDKIYQSLKISYDGLEESVKEVFLDVAFFFVGDAKAEVEEILHQCKFHPQTALTILEERSLLTVSFDEFSKYERIHMHDLIKMMGHEIVREESKKDPSKRSRLCDWNEIKDVLTKEMVGNSMEGMFLSSSRESMSLKPNAFEKMNRLRILKFNWAENIHFLEGLGSLPTELRYFCWDDFPHKSLPFISFRENLVELILKRSKLEYLWEGKMEFRRLKKINLSLSENLKAFPDLSSAPNIEEIILEMCTNCCEFLSDLKHLQNLKDLNLLCCRRLDKLPMLPTSLVRFSLSESPITELSPGFKFLTKLQQLIISGCTNLTQGKILFLEGLDSLPTELRCFYFDHFPLKSLPFTSLRENLVELILRGSKLEYLWEGEMEFRRLKKIYLSWSKNLKAFSDLSGVPNIEEIYLQGCTNCCEFLSDLKHLQKLKVLNLEYCYKLDKLPILPRSLVEFVLSDSPITELSPGFKFLTNLEILKLSDCRKLTLTEFTEFPQCIGELKSLKYLAMREAPVAELPQSIEHLHELKSLDLSRCRNLVRLPNCMHRLVSLQNIRIDHCRSLVSLPKLPPLLRRLNAEYCESLEFLKCNNWNCFRQLEYLNFMGCNKLFERSRKEIMECARVMSHRYSENEFYYRDEQISYFVPRTKIPKWFEYKSCESLITVKLPPYPHQKIRGFVFCVAAMDDSRLYSVDVTTDLINLESNVRCGYSSSGLRDHVVIWHYHFNNAEKEVLTEYIGCDLQFNIYCTNFVGRRTIFRDVLVKEWGVHMIPDEEGLAK